MKTQFVLSAIALLSVHLALISPLAYAASDASTSSATATASAQAFSNAANDAINQYMQLAARQHKDASDAPNSYIQLAARHSRCRALDIPLVGDVHIKLSSISVVSFNASVEDARLVIMEGFYHLKVHKVGYNDAHLPEVQVSYICIIYCIAIDFVHKVGYNDAHLPEVQVGYNDAHLPEVQVSYICIIYCIAIDFVHKVGYNDAHLPEVQVGYNDAHLPEVQVSYICIIYCIAIDFVHKVGYNDAHLPEVQVGYNDAHLPEVQVSYICIIYCIAIDFVHKVGYNDAHLPEVQVGYNDAHLPEVQVSYICIIYCIAIDFVHKVGYNDAHLPEVQVINAAATFDEIDLDIHSSSIDWLYQAVINAAATFDEIDLDIHSSSIDWLYQAVLKLFQALISKAVQNGISAALSTDVPEAMNHVLATLPTNFSVDSLPISLNFDYSMYTLRYVLITGFAEVDFLSALSSRQAVRESSVRQAERESLLRQAGRKSTRLLRGFDHVGRGNGKLHVAEDGVSHKLHVAEDGSSHKLHVAEEGVSHKLHVAEDGSSHKLHVAEDGFSHKLQVAEDGVAHMGDLPSQQQSATTRDFLEAEKCPFDPSPLPFAPEAIAQEARMVSLYVHENMVNCLAWGLYRAGLLKQSIVDGTIDKLHLTTDLLAQLIPQLPKQYPHQMLSTAVYVDNATVGIPHIVTLRANINITATLTWDTTLITHVTVHHVVEPGATMDVPAEKWDQTVTWFVQNYAGLFPLSQLVMQYVKSPVVSLVSLVNAETATVDKWFALSADAQRLVMQYVKSPVVSLVSLVMQKPPLWTSALHCRQMRRPA
eukprot:gene27421-4717_t